MISGDVRLVQDGVVPSARVVGSASPWDVVILDSLGNPIFGFDPSRPATAAITAITPAITSAVALAANAARRSVVFYNATNKSVLLAFAATASATAYTMSLPALGTWESELNGYTGVVSAIWPALPGAGPKLLVTEVTT